MLTDAADYFDKMLNGNWRESSEEAIEFPEDNLEAWELLIEWCYKGVLPAPEKPTGGGGGTRHDSNRFCINRLQLCFVAERYNMMLLHNLSMDSILWYVSVGRSIGVKWPVLKTWCTELFENTTSNSQGRVWLGILKLFWGLS